MMKKFTAIMMALMMVLTLTQCKPDKGNEGDTPNGSKVKVSCVIPMNKNTRSEFANLMTDGSVKWSAGTERIYLAIPNETNPQIVELTAFTTVESNILIFEGEVETGLLTEGEYEVWYLGNSKESGNSYITEEIENEVIKSISGSIASQSGDLDDLGYCHVAMTTVTAETEGEEVVLSLNGTLKNKIAIAHLDLEGITQLKGDAIVGTEYALQYNNGAFEFAVTPNAQANITVTEGTAASYVVLFPNATANVDLKSNTSKKVTFEGGVEANKIYYKHVSDMEYYPLAWEDYEEGPNANGHDYVDLGLPSGLLWATCNVGANSPEEYGDYFAWGETTTKSEYTEENCPTYGLSISQLQSQGYIDGAGNLNPQYDAAAANWGGDWRMPTKAEQEELLNNCTWTWTTQNGVNGYKVTGPSGASIFLPAAGDRIRAELNNAGSSGDYWSSTLVEYYDYDAYVLLFRSDFHHMGISGRLHGRSVRPVSGGNNAEPEEPETPETPDNNGHENGHEYVDLGLSVKWATCNVGANSPEEYGEYYAWGEIETKEEYTWQNCLTYGKELGDISGNPEYDVVAAEWGGNWRSPRLADMYELVTLCDWIWNGKGFNVVSRINGNYIFLPAAGFMNTLVADAAGTEGALDQGVLGYYWTTTPYSEELEGGTNTNKKACLLIFSSGGYMTDQGGRWNGFSIRPVVD